MPPLRYGNDADDDSSSDSSTSSLPRRRSWKKLHPHERRLSLGRMNYQEPLPYAADTKSAPKLIPELFGGKASPSNTFAPKSSDCCKNSRNRTPPLFLQFEDKSEMFPPASQSKEYYMSDSCTSIYQQNISRSENELIKRFGRLCSPEFVSKEQKTLFEDSSWSLKNPKPHDKISYCDDPKKGQCHFNKTVSSGSLSSPKRSCKTSYLAPNSVKRLKLGESPEFPVISSQEKLQASLQNQQDYSVASQTQSCAAEKLMSSKRRRFIDRSGLIISIRNEHSSCKSIKDHSEESGPDPAFQSLSMLLETDDKYTQVKNTSCAVPHTVKVTRKPLSPMKRTNFFSDNVANASDKTESVLPVDLASLNASADKTDDASSSQCQIIKRTLKTKPVCTSSKTVPHGIQSFQENSSHTDTSKHSKPKSILPLLGSISDDSGSFTGPDLPKQLQDKDNDLLDMLIASNFAENTNSPLEKNVPNIVNFGTTKVDQRCKMSFCKPFSPKILQHAQHCDLVVESILLRKRYNDMWLTIPDIDVTSLELVSGSICREFILGNQCSNEMCMNEHTTNFNLDPSDLDGVLNFKMFFKWFVTNSPLLNFKVLKALLSILCPNFSNDLRTLLLGFSGLILRMKKDFQHPLALTVLKTMVSLLGISIHEAVRLVLVFAVTHTTKAETILELFSALRISEMQNANIFLFVSTVWHINSEISFPSKLIFQVLKECLNSVPEGFPVVRDQIVLQVMKLPKSEVMKYFSSIELFLTKYLPLNSKLAFYFRAVKFRGEDPDSVIEIAWSDAHHSTRVSCDEINPKWHYWDLGESRRNGFHAVVKPNTTDFSVDPRKGLSEDELGLEELDNNEIIGDEFWEMLNRLPRTAQALNQIVGSESLEQLIKTLSCLANSFDKILMDSTLSSLYDIFCDTEDLSVVIDQVLKSIPPHSSHSKSPTLVRRSFISMVNGLVVKFYKKRDFQCALKLINIMEINGEHPMKYGPKNIDQALFEIICSHVHFECFMIKDAVQILLHGECMNSRQYKVSRASYEKHLLQLDMLVFKLLKHCNAARQSLYAINVFRGVIKMQKSLTYPIDISRYYEPVLCGSFNAQAKASRFLEHEGAMLYVLVDRLCGNNIKFHRMTYRSLLLELQDAQVSEDIVRRVLQCCIKSKAYPMFDTEKITLYCHLNTAEMYLYIRHSLKYISEQTDYKKMPSRPLNVHLDEFVNQSPESLFPVTEHLQFSTDESHYLQRTEKAFELLTGREFSELGVSFTSENDFVIPEEGVKLLLETLTPD